MIGIGIVGFGYWGPNLARNFTGLPDCQLLAICDSRPQRREQAFQLYPFTTVTDDYGALLANDAIQFILIATPAGTHFDLARQALEAGKHVLVEKPIATSSTDALALIQLAETKGLMLAVDHTYLYTSAVRKIKALIDSGELGELLYIDSVRINLGLFQNDINVLYDLAPHDLSILHYLVTKKPVSIRAMGSNHASKVMENQVYLHLEYQDNLVAHFHLNWLSPVKVRTLMICGTKKMVVFDDTEATEKVRIYDKGVEIFEKGDKRSYEMRVSYRIGDMLTPCLDHTEALRVEALHLLECLRTGERPLSNGHFGLEVVRLLEAAQQSLQNDSAKVTLPGA